MQSVWWEEDVAEQRDRHQQTAFESQGALEERRRGRSSFWRIKHTHKHNSNIGFCFNPELFISERSSEFIFKTFEIKRWIYLYVNLPAGVKHVGNGLHGCLPSLTNQSASAVGGFDTVYNLITFFLTPLSALIHLYHVSEYYLNDQHYQIS